MAAHPLGDLLSIGAYPIWSCLRIGLGYFVLFAPATNLDQLRGISRACGVSWPAG